MRAAFFFLLLSFFRKTGRGSGGFGGLGLEDDKEETVSNGGGSKRGKGF